MGQIKSYQHLSKLVQSNAMESVWAVFKLSTESVVSRRELVANSCSHRRRRRDETVSSRRRRRCVLGIRTYAQISSDTLYNR